MFDNKIFLNPFFVDSPYINEECWNNQRDRLLRYLSLNKRYHREYAIKYYTCEILAFVALVRAHLTIINFHQGHILLIDLNFFFVDL